MNNTMLLYAHLTDKELLLKVQSGQKACFEVLVRRHTQALYRVARMYGFLHNEAEYLLLNAHVKAYSRQQEIEGSISYRTWLTKVMISDCLDGKKMKGSRHADERPEPSGNVLRSAPDYDTDRLTRSEEALGTLEAHMEQLPVPLRSVYILSEIDGFSTTEIAQLLNASEENVKYRLTRAKASLRKALRRWYQYTDIYHLDQHSCERVVNSIMTHLHQAPETPAGVPTF